VSQRISKRFSKRVDKTEVLAASTVMEAIKTILKEDLEASLRDSAKADNYNKPSWSECMADQLGTQRTLRKVIEIVTIKGNIND